VAVDRACEAALAARVARRCALVGARARRARRGYWRRARGSVQIHEWDRPVASAAQANDVRQDIADRDVADKKHEAIEAKRHEDRPSTPVIAL
jgi:hypothetical protein